jgi:hypothetical protein
MKCIGEERVSIMSRSLDYGEEERKKERKKERGRL